MAGVRSKAAFGFYENSWGDSMGNSVVLTEKPEIHKHTRLIEYSSRFLTH